jgi:hypothetical protein
VVTGTIRSTASTFKPSSVELLPRLDYLLNTEREESMGIKNDGGVDGRVGGDHACRCLPADIYL